MELSLNKGYLHRHGCQKYLARLCLSQAKGAFSAEIHKESWPYGPAHWKERSRVEGRAACCPTGTRGGCLLLSREAVCWEQV